MKELAPICIFVYNRLWHTIQTIEALKKNILATESELYIFSDGAKNNEAISAVSEVRSYIQTITGFKKVQIILRERNLGLAKNIISGVTEIINLYKQVIVLEDDLVSSPFFLKYMNDALDLYKNDERVASIHGYVYPINDLPETFFIKGADCWGWATWDRSWANFEPDGRKILREVNKRGLKSEIDFNHSTGFVKMLKNQIKGKNDSWAIRWHLSAFLNNKLTLYPGKSFIKNIGCDSSGQHSIGTKVFDPLMIENYLDLSKIQRFESCEAKMKFEEYFRMINKNIFLKGFSYFLNIFKKTINNKSIKNSLRKIIVNFLPPIFVSSLKNSKLLKHGWHGKYQSWEEAKLKTTGYDDDAILNKVHQSLFKVKMGISKFERDSILFDEIQYSWPLLSGIMMAAAKLSGKIDVLDFGGSLGSTYFQNKKFLDCFNNVKWSIVEQEHFVKLGKKDFEDERIKFYLTVNDCIKEQSPNILILSSVIQYIERPYELLENLISVTNIDYILLDRTPFTDSDEKIVIQTVSPSIYNASYPCHILNLRKFKNFFFTKGYNLIEEFKSNEAKIGDIYFKGILYQKN